MRSMLEQSLPAWRKEADSAGAEDLYAYIADKTGTSRRQVKDRVFTELYGGNGEKVERKSRNYRVRVFDDGSFNYKDYDVTALSETDARCIAFLLDEGSKQVNDWDAGHIMLASLWTKVIE